MDFKSIEKQLNKYENEGKKMFTTSSFQSHSLVLLHILSKVNNKIPVYCINTGFLFPETLKFRDYIAELFDLTIINVRSAIPKIQQTNSRGDFLYTSDSVYCCFLTKVQPLETILSGHDVWINGVRADQSDVRKAMKIEQPSAFNSIRFHPMLDWTKQDIYRYLREHNLPSHPLDAEGYNSIGCEPCTRKMILGDERSSRWFGQKKTECGLNTDLVK
jgi:phosphoadenosine phosphosulfate reductase